LHQALFDQVSTARHTAGRRETGGNPPRTVGHCHRLAHGHA
jgi:hypothetical protein